MNNNSTATRTLHDSDTGELIGTATPAQIDASDAAGDTGHILIDVDGDVVTVGTWAAQQPGIRRVWVSAAPTGQTVILPSDVDDPIGYGAQWALRVAGVDRDEQQGLADIVTDEWWTIYGELTAEALTAAGYEVVRTGPIGSPDCIDAERRHADDLHDGDGLPVDMGHINHLAEVRFSRWWQDNAEALCDQHASECDARTLHDSDTGELIGTATPAQIDASDAAGDTGHILIDVDGDVVTVGTWAAQQPGVRRVYVA